MVFSFEYRVVGFRACILDSETHPPHLLPDPDPTILLKMSGGWGESKGGLETPQNALLASASVCCTEKWVDGHTMTLLEELLCQTVNYITRLQSLEQGLYHPGITSGITWGTP